MRTSAKLWVLCAALGSVAVLSAACSSTDATSASLPADQTVTALRGTIKSTGGQALAGVTIRAGAATATSNAEGRFELRAPAGTAMVTFAKDGYVNGFRAVALLEGRPTQLDVALLSLAAPIPLDAVTGGTVSGTRNAGLVVPADAFVDGAGNAVTGSVDVYLTPLDPSVGSERAAAPSFVAETGGAQAMLESFGMVDVTVKQGDQKLAVAPGKDLEVHIPAPASVASPDPSMPLWSFDEAKGVWVDEGVATYDAASKTYVGKAKHMSMWNADKPLETTCVCGLVKEKDGAALPGARVDADGVSYLGSSSTNAGNDGKFCLPVRKDSDVDVAAYHRSGGGQSRRIKSGSADTDVPPKPLDPRCADIGVWEVERDVFVSSDGTKVGCGDVGNPFAGGCAAEFGTVFGSCYKPEGACVTKFEAGGTTTRYGNGAYSQSNGGEQKYFSSSGQLCATSTVDTAGAAAGGDITILYTLPDGKAFTMIVGSGGGMIIKCPGGSETTVTPEQQKAIQACGGSGETSSECTTEGTPNTGVPTVCVDSSTCNGNVCCTIPDSTDKYCLPAATCDAIPKQ